MTTRVGIEAFGFYVPHLYLSLDTLAERQGSDPAKFSRGIGQEKIALPAHDEDVVTLGAEAARPVIERCGTDGIDTLLFATESGVDQSKSAGIFAHALLGLPANCRNVELKQACYSATAALQLACGHVMRKPRARVLIIAADVARYDRGSSGEPTQGCGAVAMLVSAVPRIVEIEPVSGCYTEDIMDFWRPNYRRTPLVDGRFSALRYLHGLVRSWTDYQAGGGRPYGEFAQFCYHLPFSRMAEKGHGHLARQAGAEADMTRCRPGMVYSRQVGNCYAASLYLALISALENTRDDLAGRPVGLFSYGSGAVSEFFSAIVQPGYRDNLPADRHRKLLRARTEVTYETYLDLRDIPDPQDGGTALIRPAARGRYRLEKIDDHKRHYVDTGR
ncbi:MAG: hydroxymethylglutaryl-CoA synthase [Rhodobacteraceae bacterium]|nr:hydroxymethylglutaryl-CoA synthase [Paracoccaceae bacterium]